MAKTNKRLLIILLSVPLLLLIPFIAMKLTNEVQWSTFDFIVAGALLLTTGLSVELIIRTMKSKRGKLILLSGILLLLVLIWVELAVGIFGTPFAGS